MKRLLSLFFLLFFSSAVFGQTEIKTQKLSLARAQELVPRFSVMPLKSCPKPSTDQTVDTLDTSNPTVKIILYSDNSWRYWHDGEAISESEVFSECWDNVKANPYKVEFADLPLKSYLWLADSMSYYHFPGPDTTASISSRYGRRHGRSHMGIDVRYPRGQELYATFSGKVRVARYISGFGNVVILRHANGLETYYAHMSAIKVKANDWVQAGDVLGLAGATGRATGSHLHYEVRYKGHAIDPEWMIDFETRELRHRVLVLKKKMLIPDSKYVPTDDSEEFDIRASDEADRLEMERLEAEMKAARYYVIKSGDTLSKIASRNGTTVSALCKLNGITSTTTLRIGRRIRVK